MRKTLVGFGLLALLAGCSSTQLTQAASTPAGQLFCGIQTSGGGALVVAVVNSAAAAIPGAGPAAAAGAIIATGASKAFVDGVCASAGGVAVAPPANPDAAPKVAVVVPAVPAS